MLGVGKFTSLIISDRKVHRIDIFDKEKNFKPILQSIGFDNEIMTSVDNHGETIVIYEKKNRIFKFYTTNFTFKSSMDGNFNFNCLKLYQDRWLCAGDNYGKIHIFDVHKKIYKKYLSTYSNQTIIDITISSDHNEIFACHDNGEISIATSKYEKGHMLSWINESISCFTSSPWKNAHLLMGSSEGFIGLYDTVVEKRIYHSCFNKKRVNCVSYSYYNENLVLSADNNSLIVLTTLNEKPQRIHKTISPVTSCSMSDGFLYAFGEANGNISVFDIRNSKEPLYFHKTSNPIDYVQFCLPFRKKTDEDLFDCLDSSEFVNSKQSRNFDDSDSLCFSVDENSSEKISENLNRSRFSTSPIFLSSASDLDSPIQSNTLTKNLKIPAYVKMDLYSNQSNEPIKSEIVSSSRQEIKSQIRIALESMENRIQTDIMSKIDQELFEFEQRVVNKIGKLFCEINEEIQNENNALKKELNKLPF